MKLLFSDSWLETVCFPDALHIAIATVHGLDILVSWNLQHIVKTKTRREVNAINVLWGYRSLDLATPEEVITS